MVELIALLVALIGCVAGQAAFHKAEVSALLDAFGTERSDWRSERQRLTAAVLAREPSAVLVPREARKLKADPPKDGDGNAIIGEPVGL